MLHYGTQRHQREPFLAKQRQPRLEGGDRGIVRMTDGDRATVLPCELFDPRELLGDRLRRPAGCP